MTGIKGTIGRHPDRPERLAIIGEDGASLAYFGQSDSEQHVRAVLAASGYEVSPDGTVWLPESH